MKKNNIQLEKTQCKNKLLIEMDKQKELLICIIGNTKDPIIIRKIFTVAVGLTN